MAAQPSRGWRLALIRAGRLPPTRHAEDGGSSCSPGFPAKEKVFKTLFLKERERKKGKWKKRADEEDTIDLGPEERPRGRGRAMGCGLEFQGTL